MPIEVLASTWSLLAAVDAVASVLWRAMSLSASTAPSPGENAPSPTAPEPSWVDQLSIVDVCLILGTALLAVLHTPTAPPSAARTADATAPAGSTNGQAR